MILKTSMLRSMNYTRWFYTIDLHKISHTCTQVYVCLTGPSYIQINAIKTTRCNHTWCSIEATYLLVSTRDINIHTCINYYVYIHIYIPWLVSIWWMKGMTLGTKSSEKLMGLDKASLPILLISLKSPNKIRYRFPARPCCLRDFSTFLGLNHTRFMNFQV